MRKTNKLLLGFIGVIVAALFFVSVLNLTQDQQKSDSARPPISGGNVQLPSGTRFNYSGEDGKDAFMLLKEQAVIEEDASGLVVSINGRKADQSKREFWALYINGEQAQVGPKEYVTQTGDRIEWRIDIY